ncbi:MAG: Gfo/Idh/MocA family oxidoreductase [Acidobacteria bacterium]|nr:Gfo/Idh/MocA family oxidoreductase [Acidobacteriota bacterium]
MSKVRTAVVGAGAFGRNHLRLLKESEHAELVAVVDADGERARAAAAEFGCRALEQAGELAGLADAAVVAVPTRAHEEVGTALLGAGIHVLVEKPIASDVASARRLIQAAADAGCVLQVGHLERFNPAVAALAKLVRIPLFFEIHRLSVFTPRSLDVDVVLDLMIHDIDIVLALTGIRPEEIRAAGISILSPKVDIANVRLAFASGCVANLTASRVSTERVRKLRLFQPSEYISLDYSRQELVRLSVSGHRQIAFSPLDVAKNEPLKLELEAFLASAATGAPVRVTGEEATRALEVATTILAKIEEHSRVVAGTLRSLKE